MTDRTRLTLHAGLLAGLGLAALGLAAAERWRGGPSDAATPIAGVGFVACGNALLAIRDRLDRRTGDPGGPGAADRGVP